MDAYWRAANFLAVGQIYLYDNPLLKEPLTLAHVKPMLLGHWGTTPGQNFIYVHLNRVIRKYDLNMIYVSGPGHGGPALVGNTYLEGTYSEIYPNISRDEAGLKRLFTQFSLSGGAFPAMYPRTARVRSMRVGSSDTPSAIPSAPYSIIRIWWSPAWWATAKRRPARSRHRGIPTNS
jgi:phosphoketolase